MFFSPSSLRTVVLALFFASTTLAACGSTPPGNAADGGAVVADGGGTPGLDGGTPVVDGGTAPDGGSTSCTTDPQCGANKVCENGGCVDACSDTANMCQGGFAVTCQNGHCRSRCLGDNTCPMGDICESFVCGPAQCSDTNPCTGTNRRCNAGRCESFTPCTADTQCPANFTCQTGTCTELPVCLGDGNCDPGQLCESGHCRTTGACTLETQCTAAQDCVGGLCVPHVCRGNSECVSPQVCSGGQCVAPGSTAFVFRVVILTPGGLIRSGETRPLVALALDQTDRPVEGITFDWSSDHPEFVAVDATTGVIRGADAAGTASIRATAHATTVRSESVSFTSLLAPASSTMRLSLIDRVSGAAVGPAKVVIGSTPYDVPANGTLSIASPSGAVDVSIFHGTHDYLTLLATNARDLIIPLSPRTALDPAAGLTGQLDLSQVSTAGPVRLGLAGLSTARTLSDLDFTRLFGDIFTSQVSIPGVGGIGVPLPGGFTVSAEVFTGFNVDVKTEFFAQGDSGLRAAWSLGGRTDIAEITSIFSRGGGGGGGGPQTGAILRQILPLFERFDHGVLPAVGIQAIPLIVDALDINGNSDRTEHVPDWRNFRRLTLTPKQPQTMRTQLVFPPLPSLGGTPVQGAAIFAGVQVPGTGFVPLGISGGFDDTGAGNVAPLVVKSAPVHSGLGVGRYAMLALAASFAGTTLPTTFSAAVSSFETLPTSVNLPSFLPFPQGGTWAPVTRAVRVPPVSGAGFLRVVFQGNSGAWEVLAPAGSTDLALNLPLIPQGVTEDLAAGSTARVDAIKLGSGTTLESLLVGAATGLQDLNRFITGFSRSDLASP